MAFNYTTNSLLVKKFFKKRFFRFLAVGFLGTLYDFAMFYGLHVFAEIEIILANLLSYGTGIILSFFINRAWTFADSSRKSKKLVLISIILGYIGLLLNTVIVYFAAEFIHVMYAKVLAVFIILIYNYTANKYLVFGVK